MGWSYNEIEDFFGKDLDPVPQTSRRKAEAIERYIERVEKTKPPPEPKDVLETVLAHYGLDAKYEVEDFVIGEYDGPYGTEDIGYHIVPRKGSLDLYDDRPSHTKEGGYTFTSWAGEWEAWEEEEYNKDPWPKIEHEGPDNGGNPQLWTPDYFRFYEWTSKYGRKRGEGTEELFRFPLYEYLAIDPYEDDNGYKIPLEELEVDDEAKDAYDANSPKWWGFLWAACKHVGWGDRQNYGTWDYFWGGRYNDLCHPDSGETPELRQAWTDSSRTWEEWMLARLEAKEKLRGSQMRFMFPEGPVSRWPREAHPQRGDLVCTVPLDSPQAHSRGVTFYLVELHHGGLTPGTSMFHLPHTATSVPGQGVRVLVHYIAQFAQQWRRVPTLWFAPTRDPRTWRQIVVPGVTVPPAVPSAPTVSPEYHNWTNVPRPAQPYTQTHAGPKLPLWIRGPKGGGRGGISGVQRKRRRRK